MATTSTPMRSWLLGGACALLAGGLFAAVWWRFPKPAADVPRPLVLVVSGDTAGWIVPCGCTANQSGGLPRRGTYVRDLRQRADVLLADAGGAPGGTSAYHRLKLEAILRGELALGLVAHNVGGPEAALGADQLRRIGKELKVPFVSANLRDSTGAPVGESLRIVEHGGQRLALTGVLSRRFVNDGFQVKDPREAVLQVISGARGSFDRLVVLAYLPEEELKQFAAGLPEADAVVGGPTGQSIRPRQLGPTLLAAATNKGKFLAELDVPARGRSGPWEGRIVELGPQFADDSEQMENLYRFRRDLAERDFTAGESGLTPGPVNLPKDYRVAGGQACAACHPGDCSAWAGSRHAHAWETLVKGGSQVDPYCQQCHTTGYGLPGGFESARRSPALTNVGCETCHGPSQAHVRDPKVRSGLARDQCVSCHDRENSPRFDYAAYWPRIQHGNDKPIRKE